MCEELGEWEVVFHDIRRARRFEILDDRSRMETDGSIGCIFQAEKGDGT